MSNTHRKLVLREQYRKSEKCVRLIRQRIFDYPEHKEAQATRCIEYLKQRMFRDYDEYDTFKHWMYACE
jgi:predicted translin family RNA/ssDNA-binding protein